MVAEGWQTVYLSGCSLQIFFLFLDDMKRFNQVKIQFSFKRRGGLFLSQCPVMYTMVKRFHDCLLPTHDVVLAASVVYPPLDEQLEILSYLDKKCSEIDSFITMKEKFIT